MMIDWYYLRQWLNALIAGVIIVALSSDGVYAQTPVYTRTVPEIERSLGAEQPASPRIRLRGVSGIVDDPVTSSPPAQSGPARWEQAAFSDYEALQGLPKSEARIHFAFGSDDVPVDAYSLLDQYVAALQGDKLADAVLMVAGHTDSVGSASYNRSLSLRRARAVKRYLVNRGISAERLVAKGFGEAYPIASNDVEEGRALNRRSEFIRVDGLRVTQR